MHIDLKTACEFRTLLLHVVLVATEFENPDWSDQDRLDVIRSVASCADEDWGWVDPAELANTLASLPAHVVEAAMGSVDYYEEGNPAQSLLSELAAG